MSILSEILSDELERLLKLEARYIAAIEKLPAGSLSVKTRGKGQYAYLARREGDRVKFEYVGRADSKEARKLGERIEERRRYREKLKKIRSEIKELRRALRIKAD